MNWKGFGRNRLWSNRGTIQELFPSSDEVGETLTQLGLLERANLNHCTTHVSITTAI
jgi:hypothetical protein